MEQKEQYSEIQRILKSNSVHGCTAEDLVHMGIVILEIDTHLFRKGIASFLACLTGGPSAIAIYLRAGCSLGAVTARYILRVAEVISYVVKQLLEYASWMRHLLIYHLTLIYLMVQY